jgi:hypothetical protein
MDKKQIIQDAIQSAEAFIEKLKKVEIQPDKYLAVFPDTMMGVRSEGGKAIFTDEPYDFDSAKIFSNSIINGHYQYPEIMHHRYYIEKCIQQQERLLKSLRLLDA